MRWGASRAAWWSPFEHSSPRGPRYQDDGRWRAPAAWHAGARSCVSGPRGYPWWVFPGLALLAGLALTGAAARARIARVLERA
jgi:hypothetical protein